MKEPFVLLIFISDERGLVMGATTIFAADCFLLAGRLLMQSGAETYRAEDTMLRMARSQGYEDAQSFVTPTGIIFSAGHESPTRIAQIPKRATDLTKIAEINTISRKLTSHQITIEEAHDQLKTLEQKNLFMSEFAQVIYAAIASGCFVILFMGSIVDMPAAAVAGGIGHWVCLRMNAIAKVKFFAEFSAAVAVGLLTILFLHIGFGFQEDKIIIGAVMPLVPGVPIANAVRDMMAGHFVSGVTKGAEASLTALAIGSGIAFVLILF